jgi:hypothetical protein
MSEPRYSVHDFNTVPGLTPNGNGTQPFSDSWQPYYLSGIEDAPTVPPSLGFNLIYPGLRHTFSGPPESAKTLAAYAIALNMIRSQERDVILIDFEMGPRGAKRRWRDIGATDIELDQRILYLAPDAAASLERMLILVALNPIVVIIDAAAGAFDNEDLDDNSRKDAERWRKLYVDPFFDNDIATIVIDHVVKNTEARGKYTIGSERKTGGGEVHFGFDTIKPVRRGSTGIYKIINHRDREGHHARGHFYDLHATSDPLTHTINCEFRPIEHTEDGAVQLPTELMQRVSHYLEAQEDDPSTRNQIILNVKGKAEYVGLAIDHLVNLKYAEEAPGPRNARLYTCLKPFIRSEWETQHPTPPPPTSSPPLPEELVSSSSLPSPPTGTGRTDDTPGTTTSSPENGKNSDDPEVRALLAHYDLLNPEPPDDGIPF